MKFVSINQEGINYLSPILLEWQPDMKYVENESFVIYENSLYKAIKTHISSEEFDLEKWQLIGGSSATAEELEELKKILDELSYVPPKITSFTNNIGIVEKGATVDTVILSWAVNKEIKSQNIDNGIGDLDPSITAHIITNANITEDTTYTLTVSDGKQTDQNKTSILFRSRIYWGVSDQESLLGNEVRETLNSELASTRKQNRSLSGNDEYLYFAIPLSFGEPIFHVNGLLNTAWELNIIPITNEFGHTEQYSVYRSTYKQNGNNILIDIS